MRKPESSPENSDSENDTESSSDVNVSDDEVVGYWKWVGVPNQNGLGLAVTRHNTS
jgi:hypothetical protein